jgi:hypothetical protein
VKRRSSVNQAKKEFLSLAKAWVLPLLVSLVMPILSGEIGTGKYTLNLMQRLLTPKIHFGIAVAKLGA